MRYPGRSRRERTNQHGRASAELEVFKMAALQGKTALVTGASRGIGRATAAALAEAGAHVLVHYGSSAKEADSLVVAMQAKGGRDNAIAADLGTADGAALLVKQVRPLVGDRLDVLVLNAGIAKS